MVGEQQAEPLSPDLTIRGTSDHGTLSPSDAVADGGCCWVISRLQISEVDTADLEQIATVPTVLVPRIPAIRASA